MARKPAPWHAPGQPEIDRYDRAVVAIRRKLGSYDTIAHKLYAHTGQSCAGVSLRRWFHDRNLPVTWACSLVEIMDGDITLFDCFPYLENVVGEVEL